MRRDLAVRRSAVIGCVALISTTALGSGADAMARKLQVDWHFWIDGGTPCLAAETCPARAGAALIDSRTSDVSFLVGACGTETEGLGRGAQEN